MAELEEALEARKPEPCVIGQETEAGPSNGRAQGRDRPSASIPRSREVTCSSSPRSLPRSFFFALCLPVEVLIVVETGTQL